jgi:hypothetical protein
VGINSAGGDASDGLRSRQRRLGPTRCALNSTSHASVSCSYGRFEASTMLLIGGAGYISAYSKTRLREDFQLFTVAACRAVVALTGELRNLAHIPHTVEERKIEFHRR